MQVYGYYRSGALVWIFATYVLTLAQAAHIRVKRQAQMDPLLRVVCDGKADGPYPHPYYCGSYIQCFNGDYSEKDCPGNMYYNTKAKSCDFRRLIKCRTVDGMIETEAESAKFGPEIPVQVEHPAITKKPAVV
ncbi:hypothetical protein BV898_15430 [Hypsibius exemplaris]|uniref:Chitin-binding type-2 domain-containing protein n=1 Tax=Hypsibius exemplaris TaxID=2072580 RepID=A0A9X6RKB8_HYPEX|nr:hypothetical protein BV898_15430 [Hypsibius exemplaris]